MRRFTKSALIGLALFAVAVGIPSQGSAASQFYGFEVGIVVSDENAYEFTATVSDLRNDEVLAAPRIIARLGDGAETTSEATDSKMKVYVTVAVDKLGTKATYTAEVRKGRKVVARQKGTIQLRK